MEIGTTKTEGADRSATSVAAEPGQGLFSEFEGAGVCVVTRVGLRHMQGTGQHFVVQGFCNLDQTGNAGCALGVANLAFHRAQHCLIRHATTGHKHLGQCGQFRAVAHHRAGAMRFHQTHLGRQHARLQVSAFQRTLLAFLARRSQAQALAIA